MTEVSQALREFLLAEVLRFTRQACKLPGVQRIALVGSLVTPKLLPKDADLLVTVDPGADLSALARLGRQIKGHGQARNTGADIFVSSPDHFYIGRICRWRDCQPGLRAACPARNCGRREYLNDDLHDVELTQALVAAPPIELWPNMLCRVEVPADVQHGLLQLLARALRPDSGGAARSAAAHPHD